MSDRLLSNEDLAEMCGVPVWTVRKWRDKGTGPAAIRIGKHLRYRPEDVDQWLADKVERREAV